MPRANGVSPFRIVERQRKFCATKTLEPIKKRDHNQREIERETREIRGHFLGHTGDLQTHLPAQFQHRAPPVVPPVAGRNGEGIGVRHGSPRHSQRVPVKRVRPGAAGIDRDVAGNRRGPFVLLDAADGRRGGDRGRRLRVGHPADHDATRAGTLPPEQTYYRLGLFRLG